MCRKSITLLPISSAVGAVHLKNISWQQQQQVDGLCCSHVCGDSSQDDVADASAAQHEVQVCTAQNSTTLWTPVNF
jgi:hypothetical protein